MKPSSYLFFLSGLFICFAEKNQFFFIVASIFLLLATADTGGRYMQTKDLGQALKESIIPTMAGFFLGSVLLLCFNFL